MMNAYRAALCAAAGSVGLVTFSASPVHAEEAAPSQGDNEIVVTAQKRTERLLDVPMSIAAVSGAQLAATGVGSTIDLQQLTPGIVATHNSFSFTPSIRGISSFGSSAGDEANVSVYLDDVYLGAEMAGTLDLMDIERIEILKGPQGTLFGRNATGGAIRIVTRAPSFTPRADLSADYGFEFNEVKLGAYVSGPISEKIAVSVSGNYRKGDGFIKGISQNVGKRYGGPDNGVIRGKLLLQPSDDFKVTIAADAFKASDNSVFASTPTNGANPFPGPGSVVNLPYRYAGDTQPISKMHGHAASIDASWDAADAVTIRSITAYRYSYGSFQTDQDRTNTGHGAVDLAITQKNVSQELNFSGPSNGTLTWLAGLYYYHASAANPYLTSFTNSAPTGTVGSSFTDTQRTNAYAGFADITYNVSDQFHLTGGFRYSSESKRYTYRDLVRIGLPLRSVSANATFKSPTYRAVARYDFAEDANIYISYSTGFKSGVFNANSPVGNPVEPEKIKAIEVGAKARLAGITLTAAAFHYDYSNIQVQAASLVNGTSVIVLNNAAKARLEGLEFTADGRLGSHLSFNAGIGWLPTAKYSKYTTAQVYIPNPATGFSTVFVPYDASGSRMQRAPKLTANVRVTYTAALLGGEIAATVNESYTGQEYFQPANLTPIKGFNLVNTRLAWTDPQKRFTYSLWANNAFNKAYSTYGGANTLGDATIWSPRRQIGIGIAAAL